jgi:copper chaperone CopZ
MKFGMSRWVLLGLLALAGCRVSDVRVLTVNVPAMSAETDVERIKKSLASLNGLDREKTTFDVAGRTVTVTYDSMVVAHKNIEIAIAEAGYDANLIKAIPPPAAK